MKASPTHSPILLLAVSLFNVAALAVFIFLFAGIRSANQRISALNSEVEFQSKQEAALRSMKAVVGESAALRGALDAYFISKDDEASFLTLLESVGADAGVKVTIVSAGEGELPDSEDIREVRLKISGEGGWREAVRFLGLLEFLPYASEVHEFTLSRREDGIWRLDVALKALKHS